jgi:hypothetical protein
VDFAKYAAMLVFRAQETSRREREKLKGRAAIVRQIILLPLTGGLSLLNYLRGKARGE